VTDRDIPVIQFIVVVLAAFYVVVKHHHRRARAAVVATTEDPDVTFVPDPVWTSRCEPRAASPNQLRRHEWLTFCTGQAAESRERSGLYSRPLYASERESVVGAIWTPCSPTGHFPLHSPLSTHIYIHTSALGPILLAPGRTARSRISRCDTFSLQLSL